MASDRLGAKAAPNEIKEERRGRRVTPVGRARKPSETGRAPPGEFMGASPAPQRNAKSRGQRSEAARPCGQYRGRDAERRMPRPVGE